MRVFVFPHKFFGFKKLQNGWNLAFLIHFWGLPSTQPDPPNGTPTGGYQLDGVVLAGCKMLNAGNKNKVLRLEKHPPCPHHCQQEFSRKSFP